MIPLKKQKNGNTSNVNVLRPVNTNFKIIFATVKTETSLQIKTSRTSDPTIHDLQQDPG